MRRSSIAVALLATAVAAVALASGTGASTGSHHHRRHLRIIFDRQLVSPDYDIFSMKTSGKGVRNLTKNPADDWGAKASPNGKKIAFTSERDSEGNDEVFVMNADGSHVKKLTDQPDGVYSEWPHWSPDGRKIIFDSNRHKDAPALYVMKSDGSGEHSLHERGFDASFSPNGKKIAYYDSTGNDEVYIANADGSGSHDITNNPASDSEPAWFPSGKKLVFVSSRATGDADVFTMDVHGKHVHRLTQSTGSDGDPAVDASGKHIAFTSSRGGKPSSVFTMGANGSHQHALTPRKHYEEFPDWARLAG